MNDHNQETHLAIRELAAEIRRFRRAMLVSFALLTFTAGFVLFAFRSPVSYWALFATAGIFLLWASISSFSKVIAEIREEARRQHSEASSDPKKGLPESP